MPVKLSTLVPNPDDLLALEVEELAGALLVHLNSCRPGDCIAVQHGQINQDAFFGEDRRGKVPEYGARQEQVDLALLEAWAWLQNEGFLVRKSGGHNWLFVSRRGKQITSLEDFSAYLKAHLLPRRQIHSLVASKVYPAFLRGEYDTAVFQAFREVEVAVRRGGGFPDDLVGVNLMREAFKPAKNNNPAGPLTDELLPIAEQEGMASLFAGAIGLYKNPQSHRNAPTDATDAAEVIVFASQLLRIIDRVKPQANRGENR
jgi:uncharacterized protein (TIGR02391 family)